MASITQTDVAQLVKDMDEFYQPNAEACGKSTPAQMLLLVARLEDYTKRVKQAASEYNLATEWVDPTTGAVKTTGSPYNPQFSVDMGNWEQRLAHYRRVLEHVSPDQTQTKSGCEMIYKQVTAPLLDGIWYEPLPGIMLNDASKGRINTGEGHPSVDVTTTVGGDDHPGGHSTAKPPDVISPFTLGNQVLVWKEHQDERMRQFWQDLKENALALPGKVADALGGAGKKIGEVLLPIGIGLLGVSAAVATALALSNRRKAKKLSHDMERDRALNPARRLRRLTR